MDAEVSTRNRGSSAAQGSGSPALPELEGVRHRWIDLPGLRMHVAEAGEGPPIVLLHGITQHWWQWRLMIPDLARHHRLIMPDLRGAGWSESPRTGYTREQQLGDLLALLGALDLDRVDLITHDSGSLLGYQLRLRHPERVRRLVSLSIPAPYFRLSVGFLTAFLRYEWRGLVLAPLRDPACARATSARNRRFILPEAARVLSGSYRRSRLMVPTLVLVGAQDPNLRPEFLDGVDAYVDDYEIEYVDGVSHWVADEKRELVSRRALEFFAPA